MFKKSIIYYFSIILFIFGILFVINFSTNITGAIIGTNIEPLRSVGIGFSLIFISTVLFLIEASELEKKLDFKDIRKKFREVQNVNATQESQHDSIDNAIKESTKNDKGWLDLYKLDTEEGQEKAYKAAMKVATSKDNPFYKKIDGISKEHSEYISLRSIGLDPFKLKKQLYEEGRGYLNDRPKQERRMMHERQKQELQELPLADIKDKDIEDIVDYTIPKDVVLDKKPKTVDEAKTLLRTYYIQDGKLGEGELKQAKYIKKDKAA
jgi:hypothetical protein